LDTIKISENGTVVLHHQRYAAHGTAYWETATLHLSSGGLQEIDAAVKESGVLSLYRYYDGGVADGTQWVFWIQQGDREKSIYCNNSFPSAMVSFAETLDNILERNGLAAVVWQRVPDARADSTKRHFGTVSSVSRSISRCH
jgi:hypothetical protein